MTETQQRTQAIRAAIWPLREQGKTAAQIAEATGLPYERVRYYLRKSCGALDRLHAPFIQHIRAGLPPKVASAEVGIATPTAWKWAAAAGFRKQWITDAEFSEVLAKRKGSA